ncbi:DGQHR domain-containing protein [Sphingomonas sp.]|jgi:DGQHR domain-containing protein|uniref:DGQHR domain-containing protein n=1 Tax=Sphingomonas sp. TaxID=28214 RepID=UPI003568603F
MPSIEILCHSGRSADRRVLLGFAPARQLHAISFPDILDERTGDGYQRRFNSSHSLDFRRYIREEGSTTIPLTFNLRPRDDNAWRLLEAEHRSALLKIDSDSGPVMAQVDCQHRLGHLADLDVELPFMCFVGLTVEEEMAVFTVINRKAKGLNRSLLDFHDARLCEDLANDRPELFIALCLSNDPVSPWCGQLDVGGNRVSGMSRKASLRTLQKAVRRFLQRSSILKQRTPEEAARVVLDFWVAVSIAMRDDWSRPRGSLLAKGVGVYALMEIAADMWRENGAALTKDLMIAQLADLAGEVDWSSEGPLRGLGGESGVAAAASKLREIRSRLTVRQAA